MFFRKNIHKLIQEKFEFLLKCGFQLKKYQMGADLEANYTKDGISIVAWYYYGINNYYEKIYTFDVIIKKNNVRKRLLECLDLFDKKELTKLEIEIKNKQIREQINIYSFFLKNNINVLF